MPSKSPAQARLFAAVAHNKAFAAKVGIPQSVGRDFNRADTGTGILRRAEGGRMNYLDFLQGRQMPNLFGGQGGGMDASWTGSPYSMGMGQGGAGLAGLAGMPQSGGFPQQQMLPQVQGGLDHVRSALANLPPQAQQVLQGLFNRQQPGAAGQSQPSSLPPSPFAQRPPDGISVPQPPPQAPPPPAYMGMSGLGMNGSGVGQATPQTPSLPSMPAGLGGFFGGASFPQRMPQMPQPLSQAPAGSQPSMGGAGSAPGSFAGGGSAYRGDREKLSLEKELAASHAILRNLLGNLKYRADDANQARAISNAVPRGFMEEVPEQGVPPDPTYPLQALPHRGGVPPPQRSPYGHSVPIMRGLGDEGPELAAGGAPTAPWYERGAMYRLNRDSAGLLKSNVPGRTDKLNLNVGSGSYVLPADTVSALGQNNSMAGGKILDRMFNKGPRGGANLGLKGRLRAGRMFMADGGATQNVPILAAGGEYVVEPEHVSRLGDGDMKRGHEVLDRFVKNVRDKHVKTLRKLPPPKKR